MRINEIVESASDREIAADGARQAQLFYDSKLKGYPSSPHAKGTREDRIWTKAFREAERRIDKDIHDEYVERDQLYYD
jgi:hypothetical protein